MATPGDKAILNSIFNPLLPVGEGVYDDALPPQFSPSENEENVSPAVLQAGRHEVAGVAAAEAGDLPAAVAAFNRAVSVAPDWASGYNNRAQALRMQGKVDEALEDLDKAISLSGGDGRAGCQALTQRGIIRRLRGQDEAAKADFTKAAELGSEFAKSQLVQMNPYAALCNKMLGDVIRQLQGGPNGA